MESLRLIWSLTKIILLFSFVFLFILFIKFIVNPYFTRQKYQKYRNVEQSKSFEYFKGDVTEVANNIANKRFMFWHYVSLALREQPPDIYLKFVGPTPVFTLFSIKAVKEYVKQFPNRIDRSDFIDKIVGKMFMGSLGTAKTDQKWKDQRDLIMKSLGINFSSRYIPTLLKTFETTLGSLELGTEIDLTQVVSRIEFDFICEMIFGRDFKEAIENKLVYTKLDGTSEQLSFAEMFGKIVGDIMSSAFNPIGVIFGFVSDYNLIKPYSTIKKNIREMRRGLSEFLKSTTDDSSFYSQVKTNELFTEEELLSNLILLIFAGSDTTAHTTVSLLYYLNKYPDVARRLKEGYEKAGIIVKGKLQKDKIRYDVLEE